MFIEKTPHTSKMLSMRVDDEMYYSLRALSDKLNMDISTIVRLAVANLLIKARERTPESWDELKSL